MLPLCAHCSAIKFPTVFRDDPPQRPVGVTPGTRQAPFRFPKDWSIDYYGVLTLHDGGKGRIETIELCTGREFGQTASTCRLCSLIWKAYMRTRFETGVGNEHVYKVCQIYRPLLCCFGHNPNLYPHLDRENRPVHGSKRWPRNVDKMHVFVPVVGPPKGYARIELDCYAEQGEYPSLPAQKDCRIEGYIP